MPLLIAGGIKCILCDSIGKALWEPSTVALVRTPGLFVQYRMLARSLLQEQTSLDQRWSWESQTCLSLLRISHVPSTSPRSIAYVSEQNRAPDTWTSMLWRTRRNQVTQVSYTVCLMMGRALENMDQTRRCGVLCWGLGLGGSHLRKGFFSCCCDKILLLQQCKVRSILVRKAEKRKSEAAVTVHPQRPERCMRYTQGVVQL